jgi:hypothetical protein
LWGLARAAAARRAAKAAVERGEVEPDPHEVAGEPNQLAYGMLSAVTENPAERAMLRMRQAARPPAGRAYTPEFERELRHTVLPLDAASLGLLAAGPFGRIAGRVAGPIASRLGSAALGGLGLALEPSEAQAGPVSKALGAGKKLAAGLAKYLTPEGAAIEGPEFEKRMTETKAAIKEMPKGAGPLDLDPANLRMDVRQRDIPRYEPPRGLPPRMQRALENPEVIKGVERSMQQGIKMGAQNWYLNNPIYQAWIKELGPEEGHREFQRFMDYVAATSPQTKVPENIRNASYFYAMHGRELPEQLPYPYGGKAQDLHVSNIDKLIAGEQGGSVGASFAPEFRGWDIYTNPKPVSFAEDLSGNLVPVAADTHATRNVAMRTGDPEWLATQIQEKIKQDKAPSEFQETYGKIKRTPEGMVVTYRPQQLLEQGRIDMQNALDIPPFWVGKPRKTEYGAMEGLYGDIGARLGLWPAQGQSAAWSGAAKLTGLGTPPELTFPEMFNNRVQYTAMMRGEDPQDTLRKLIRKQAPLLGWAGGTPLAAEAMRATGEEPARPTKVYQEEM